MIILHKCGGVRESETNIIFCHFDPFLPFPSPDNQKNQNIKTETTPWRY